MAVAELLLGSVILPRIDSPQIISRLTEFKWFHKIETENETITPEIDDLLLRAQKMHQSIDEVVKGLGIPPVVGIMEILFKGAVIKKTKSELSEIKSMIDDLEKKTPKIIDNASKLLQRQEILRWGNNDRVAIRVRGFVNGLRDLKGLVGI